MNRTRVLIVDDHAVLRSGLKLLIDAQQDLQVVGEAGTLARAMEIAPELKPDIITLDLSMPGPSGVASVQRLRALVPGARIIVLTMYDDPAYVRTAMAMGASGYVVKSAADTELISAIRAVSRGRAFIDIGESATLGSLLGPGAGEADAPTPLDSLSDRERQVLADVAKGHTNQHIADRLGLSVKTVESYRSRLMKKLKLKNRADLVRLAIEMGELGPGAGP